MRSRVQLINRFYSTDFVFNLYKPSHSKNVILSKLLTTKQIQDKYKPNLIYKEIELAYNRNKNRLEKFITEYKDILLTESRYTSSSEYITYYVESLNAHPLMSPKKCPIYQALTEKRSNNVANLATIIGIVFCFAIPMIISYILSMIIDTNVEFLILIDHRSRYFLNI